MAFLGKKPKLEQSLEQLRARHEALTAKRAKGAAELEMAQSVRQEFLLGGDLDDADVGESVQRRVDIAAQTLAGFDVALRALDEQITAADKALNDEKLKAIWLADSKILAKDVGDIRVMTPRVLELVRTYAALFQKPTISGLRFEASRVGDYTADFVNQLETAMSVLQPDLDGAVGNVATGKEKLPKLTPVLKIVQPEPEQRTTWFALQILKFQQDGQQKLVARYDLASLTEAQSRMGLELNVIVPLDHESVPGLRARQVTQIAQAHHAYDLDSGQRPQGVAIMDVPNKERHRPHYQLPPTASADLPAPRAAAGVRNELPKGFEEHPRMKDGPYQMTVDPKREQIKGDGDA